LLLKVEVEGAGSVTVDSNTGLRFMSMPNREAYGNYRVKIY